MAVFKYSLAKKGKVHCIGCGKKTAVNYIETETGNIISDAMRCDRQSNCGFHRKPEDNKPISNIHTEVVQKETSYLSLKILEQHYLNPNICDFKKFLSTLFTDEQIHEVTQKYFISFHKSWNSSTIFWQIDELERIRTGKIMKYNPITGKRVKDQEGKSLINWVHIYHKPFELKQCLFGLHLLKEYPNKPIALFESEKTAVIMSLHLTDFICMATGSNSGFKIQYLKPLKLRKVLAFPDKGEFENWNKIATDLNAFGYNIEVQDILENTEHPDGIDLADLYTKK